MIRKPQNNTYAIGAELFCDYSPSISTASAVACRLFILFSHAANRKMPINKARITDCVFINNKLFVDAKFGWKKLIAKTKNSFCEK